jgi:putative nucleotidyltransferase with HDIG domain
MSISAILPAVQAPHTQGYFGDVQLSTEEQEPNLQQWVSVFAAGGLPTLSGYVFELNSLLDQKMPPWQQLARIISTDPSLSAEVLRQANHYLLKGHAEVLTVEAALRALGAERLRTLVLTSRLLDLTGHVSEWNCVQSFWQHSYLSGRTCELIAERLGYASPRVAYVAGLLHDIGELPLLLDRLNADRASSNNTVSHSELGRQLAEAWGLPEKLVEACSLHHAPALSKVDPLLMRILYIADRFCSQCGLNIGGPMRQLLPASQVAAENILADELPDLGAAQRSEMASALRDQFLTIMELLEFSPVGVLRAATATVAPACLRQSAC